MVRRSRRQLKNPLEKYGQLKYHLVIVQQRKGAPTLSSRILTLEPMRSLTSGMSNYYCRARRVGYKGHGTKAFFNSRQIEVWSKSRNCTVYAIMDIPLQNLMQDEIPSYDYEIEEIENEPSESSIS